MKSPLESARAFLKFAKDGCHMDLIWMGFIIKYLFSYMDGVGDNDDFGNVFFTACLTNTTSHSKEFHFCASDEDYMVNYLDQRVVTYVNV